MTLATLADVRELMRHLPGTPGAANVALGRRGSWRGKVTVNICSRHGKESRTTEEARCADPGRDKYSGTGMGRKHA
jgi:hypothetical protein